MMKKFTFLSITFLSLQFAQAGGVRVGNGGFLVQCQGDTHYQSLDYVLAANDFGKLWANPNFDTAEEYLNRLSVLLKQKLPSYADSFNEYVGQIYNAEVSKKYRWSNTDFRSGTIDGSDARALPYWCRNSRGSTQLVQAVVRTSTQSTTTFFYDRKIITSLGHDLPLQLSFLFVHEWIWNFTKDPKKNRDLTYFLHSPQFEKMTAEDATTFIKTLGF